MTAAVTQTAGCAVRASDETRYLRIPRPAEKRHLRIPRAAERRDLRNARSTEQRYLRIPRSADVSASEKAGRANRRSAYFISGAACFGIWMP